MNITIREKIKNYVLYIFWLNRTYVYNKDGRYLIINTKWEIQSNLDWMSPKYWTVYQWLKNKSYFLNNK